MSGSPHTRPADGDLDEPPTHAVWITSTYPWEQEPVGGIFFATQARALTRRGVRVTVVTPTPMAPWPLPLLQGRWKSYADAPRSMTDEGVTILRPRYLNIPGQPSIARPDRFIARAAERTRKRWADARVIHGHYAVTGLAAWRMARKLDLPLVLSFHGGDLNSWPDEYPDRVRDLRAAMRDAAAVIVVSAPLAGRVRELSGVEPFQLPIGSDHDRLAGLTLERTQARRLLGLPLDATIVLFVGNLIRAKGIQELVDAVRLVGPPFTAVLVGAGDLIGYGATPDMDGRLLYRGLRPNEEVVRYMSAADVLVLASYTEGLPTVLVEAGSVGLPVIASQVGGIPDLLADGRGALLPDISAASIATALRTFASDRDAALTGAAGLKAYVMEHHSADASAARLAELYRSIARH